MSDSRWTQTIANIKGELALIENGAHNIGVRSQASQREAEYLKIEFLRYSLEEQRKAGARARGMGLLARDNKKMGISLAITVGGLIFGGLASKNKYVALDSGLSGFEGALQGLGKAAWAVSLAKELIVAPYGALLREVMWVTFESLMKALSELKKEALQGKPMGSLDDIIKGLRQSLRLIRVLIPIRN